MEQISESEKKESNQSTAKQPSTYPNEFRSPDARPLLFMIFIAIALVFLGARSLLSNSDFRYVLVRSVIVLPVFFVIYSRSEKVVFSLLPDGIRLGDKTLIPCDKINKVKLQKNITWIFFRDSSGKEKKNVINFCDINKTTRSEAKPAMVQWLREHNLQALITEE